MTEQDLKKENKKLKAELKHKQIIINNLKALVASIEAELKEARKAAVCHAS
jgi:cell division septum initiation protein DivIVA